MRRFRVLFVLSIAVGALVLTACGQSSDDTAADSAAPAATSAPEAEPTAAPTATPLPTATAIPEPTEAPEPTPVPEPAEAAADASAEAPAGDDGSTCAADATPGQTSTTIESGGNSYDYSLLIPKTYDGTPLALVLNFHGLGSQASEQAAFSGYPALAESEGFVVAHPTGQPDAGGSNSWELSAFDDPARDDAQFVRDLIDEVSTTVCVDPLRIYATGMSNGGFFSGEMVCQLGDRIAAAASVAGVSHSIACDPIRPMPYIAFHGTADEVVPFAGGGESTLGTSAFFEQVMPDEFAEFAADFNCDADPVANEISDAVTRFDYVGCAEDVEMSFYEIVGQGHNWPGSTLGKTLEAMLGANNMDIDASALSWEFFRRNPLPADLL